MATQLETVSRADALHADDPQIRNYFDRPHRSRDFAEAWRWTRAYMRDSWKRSRQPGDDPQLGENDDMGLDLLTDAQRAAHATLPTWTDEDEHRLRENAVEKIARGRFPQHGEHLHYWLTMLRMYLELRAAIGPTSVAAMVTKAITDAAAPADNLPSMLRDFEAIRVKRLLLGDLPKLIEGLPNLGEPSIVPKPHFDMGEIIRVRDYLGSIPMAVELFEQANKLLKRKTRGLDLYDVAAIYAIFRKNLRVAKYGDGGIPQKSVLAFSQSEEFLNRSARISNI